MAQAIARATNEINMKNGFVFSEDEFAFTGAGQLSMGAGIETSTRFAHDYSKTAQSIAWRKTATARTGSINIAFNHSQVENIFNEIAKYEEIAGQAGDLYWNSKNLGKFLIRSVQISLALDGIDIISSAQIGLEIVEAYQKQSKSSQKSVKVEVF